MMEFKFKKEKDARDIELSKFYELNPSAPYDGLSICERCGNEYEWTWSIRDAIFSLFSFRSFQFSEPGKRVPNVAWFECGYFVTPITSHFNLPCSSEICGKCVSDLFPAFMRYRDVCEVDLSIKYLERAISCRKNFLKHKVKSKQQANLEKCLSMPQREFSTATWTWIEPLPSID